jgi:MFS family permease
LVVGALGLVLAPVFVYAVREPARGGAEPSARGEAPPRVSAKRKALFGKVSFWGLSLGGAMSSVMGYGMFFWLPSFFVRSYHLSLPQVSWYLASLTLVGGVMGIWIGGWLTDRLGSRRRSAYALVPAAAFVLCVPFYAFGVLAPPSLLTLPLFLVPTALALVWLGPTICAVQHLVPADQRAFASASFLFINNLIGLGLGTVMIGGLSDHFKSHYGSESLRYAILSGTGFYLLAALLFVIAARRLSRDWHE